MSHYRLRDDLERADLDGFALPLGIEPTGLEPPMQGYTCEFSAGDEDDPDTYSFHVVVSHERLRPILEQVFTLLPPEVFAIVEIGSRDAYRNVDVFLAQEPVPLATFLDTWKRLEPLLLEDATLAAGANSEEPFIEVFLDQWKSLAIHVSPSMHEEVESLLQECGLEEVVQTWPVDEEHWEKLSARPVLAVENDSDPDLDDLLLDLRHEWLLELNIDPDTNVDETGRDLGLTLWHALVIVTAADSEAEWLCESGVANQQTAGAYCSVWATAGSLSEMEKLIADALQDYPEWRFSEVFTIDRVAYDSRPDELADLPPRRRECRVHLVQIDPWEIPPEEARRA